MAGLFSTPSVPKIEVQQPTPAVIDESKNRAKTLEALAKRRGRAAQLLAGDYTNNNRTNNNSNQIAGQAIATKLLLGQ
jgi:hypothetical protein